MFHRGFNFPSSITCNWLGEAWLAAGHRGGSQVRGAFVEAWRSVESIRRPFGKMSTPQTGEGFAAVRPWYCALAQNRPVFDLVVSFAYSMFRSKFRKVSLLHFHIICTSDMSHLSTRFALVSGDSSFTGSEEHKPSRLRAGTKRESKFRVAERDRFSSRWVVGPF